VHYPEAGVQVPAGTVEVGEALDEALHREIKEESGLVGLQLVALLATQHVYSTTKSQWQEQNFFQLQAPDDLPEEWLHVVRGNGEDENLHFIYSWFDVSKAADTLIAGQGKYLNKLLSVTP